MSKNKSKSSSNNNIKKERSLEWFYLLPIMFIVAIIPLMVYAKLISLDDFERLNWKGGETNTDFFSYYKAMFFAASAFLSGILLVLLKLTGVPSLKKSKYYIPLGIYLLFVVISYFLSDFDRTSTRM